MGTPSRLLALGLVASGGWPSAAEAAPGEPMVSSIQIVGAHQVDVNDIKKGLATTERQWWEMRFLRQPHLLDPNEWQTDLARILRRCQAQGFYQCQLLYYEVLRQGDGDVQLVTHIDEGQPTYVSDVRGLESIPPEAKDEALKDPPLRQGDVFRQSSWTQLKHRVLAALLRQGYRDARVEGRVYVGEQTHRADAVLDVTAGQRYRFGEVTGPDGKSIASRQRIADQVQAVIRPGKWFSPRALEEAKLRLLRMDVFGGVRVIARAPAPDTDTIPVQVEVEEAPFTTQSVHLGGLVDPARSEVHASFEHTDRNFLGDLRRLDLSFKLGYALTPGLLAALAPPDARSRTVHSGATLGAQAQLEQPGFLLPDLKVQLSLGAEHGLEPGFEYNQGRVRLGAIWQPRPELSVFPSYNLELYQLSGLLTQGATFGSQDLGCVPGTSRGCDVTLSFAELVLEYDGRDDRLTSHNGVYARLSVQGGGGPLLGNFNYLRVQPEVRAYKTFDSFPRLTLAARLKLGTLVPLGDTAESSIVSRFSLGGPYSMRGFAFQRLSPMLAVGREHPETIPIGGDGQLESSLEARYRITYALHGAVFLDTGFVTPGSFNFADPGYVPGNMMYAVGIGVRYHSSVGIIRVDVARRLEAGPALHVAPGTPAQVAQPGCFDLLPPSNPTSYAGAPEGLCTFHLSIGEAF